MCICDVMPWAQLKECGRASMFDSKAQPANNNWSLSLKP